MPEPNVSKQKILDTLESSTNIFPRGIDILEDVALTEIGDIDLPQREEEQPPKAAKAKGKEKFIDIDEMEETYEEERA